ncbi:MAG: response regulator [Candidatus Kuenenia sp.]|nr:response regulator [Candidatus Kuenenia hertensis]
MENIKKKILIVDDDDEVLDSLGSFLKVSGYDVTTCDNPETAVAKATSYNFNVVLSDIKMPKMSGIQFLQHIHTINPELPVILMTAYAELNNAVSALRAGAFDFILKPYKPELLINSLEKAIEFNRLRQMEKNYKKSLEDTIEKRTQELAQKNIALSEILGQLEIEKKQLQDNIIANVEKLILPAIQKLKLKGESRKYVELLQKNIEELTSSFGITLTKEKYKLSPREIEICNMVKSGLTNKEIARLLNISLRTIEKHRDNIRNKLGIIKKDTNLSTFLKTF